MFSKDHVQPKLILVIHGHSCQVTKEALKFTQNRALEYTQYAP